MEDNVLLRKLQGGELLQARDRLFLDRLQETRRKVGAGQQFWSRGTRLDRTFIVQDGWMMRYLLTPAGTRQIVSIALPGDILGLHVNYRRVASFDVETITDCVVSEIPRECLDELYRHHPKLAAALNWASVRDHAVLAQHIVSLGRRNARERLIFVLLELWNRLLLVGRAWDHNFPIPLTQNELGDWLGLSVVHVNRTLRQLEEEGMIQRQHGRILLKDVEKMKAVSDYNGDHIENFFLA